MDEHPSHLRIGYFGCCLDFVLKSARRGIGNFKVTKQKGILKIKYK
jgi:hypothetical protein